MTCRRYLFRAVKQIPLWVPPATGLASALGHGHNPHVVFLAMVVVTGPTHRDANAKTLASNMRRGYRHRAGDTFLN